MNLLLDLSLHGSIVFLLVWTLDRMLSGKIGTRARRYWWVLVPLSFLISLPLPVLPAMSAAPLAQLASASAFIERTDVVTREASRGVGLDGNLIGLFWLAGVVIYLLTVALQTRSALRRWSGERLSTDSALLELLEDCKQAAGVTAPIGLVVSDRIPALAILGWLRPRILIPRKLISSLSPIQLRAVLLHELAHFHFLDVPLTWIFTLARAVHWFNPCAHLAFHSWIRFREEAADDAAIIWMKDASGASYGQALLHAIRQVSGAPAPFSALAIGESLHHLKRRLIMINHHHKKSPGLLCTGLILTFILTGFILRPVRADDVADAKPVAVAAMQAWLGEIDQGQYGQSWKDAAASFQKAIGLNQWIATLNSARVSPGKCTARTLASAIHETEVPSPTGNVKGDFYVAQFDSSFENLKYAVETVCFEKAPDGTWKASGYYVKPRP